MAVRLTTLVVLVIVAATLIAGLIVGAQRDDNEGPVDLIVRNARVYTANPQGDMADAVAIRGNQILRVGSDREITRLQRPQTVVIDAKGATVLPGFNDAHVELIAGGTLLGRVDLLDATSVEEIERRISAWAGANPTAPWVLGGGWHPGAFPDGVPPRHALDRLVPDRPAELLSADGRTSWVNSRALHLAKIGKRTASPAHGLIGRDPRTHEPIGILQDAAILLVSRLVPAVSPTDRARALNAAVVEAHRYGITSMQDAGGTMEDFAAYAEARHTGGLPMRVYSALSLQGDPSDAQLERLDAVMAKYPDDPLFKAGGISVNVGDAPFAGPLSAQHGASRRSSVPARVDPDALNRLIRRLDAHGWQIFAEAAGDREVGLTLNAYEHAVRSNPSRTRERRHRIENAHTLLTSDLPRVGLLSVLASMRPLEIPGPDSDTDTAAEPADGESPGPSPVSGVLSIARGRVAFGSGWPAAPLDPLLGLRSALQLPADGSARPRMSLKSAIDSYTSAAARASFDEQRKGAITPGMLADLVVLSGDVFQSPGSALETAHVAVTIFDGKVVYRRGAN